MFHADCKQPNSISSRDSLQIVHNAMVSFKLQQVRTLLTHGPYFKKRRMYFLRCVLTMAKSGSSIAVKAFAKQILHWNVLSKNEVAVIEHILKRAGEENLRVLLKSGIIAHVKKCSGRDAFVHIFGNASVVELMKNVEFDVDKRGFNGQTALHIAVQNKLPKNVEFLLKRGADPNAKDDDGETPMFEILWSIKNPTHGVKCVELLLLNGADVQACDYGGVSFVYYASRTNAALDLLELVLTHLAVREAMSLPIERLILDQIAVRDRSRNLLEECRKRLEETKACEVCDGVTMFDMITESVSRRVNAMDCKNVFDFLERRSDCDNRFYDNILRDRLDGIVKMNDLKREAKIVLFDSIEALRPYDFVIDKIVSYFSRKDLVKFE